MRFKVLLLSISLFTSCRECDSFEKLAEEIYQEQRAKYEDFKDPVGPLRNVFDSILSSRMPSDKLFKVEELTANRADLRSFLQKIDVDRIGVNTLNVPNATKVLLLFPATQTLQQNKGKCADRVIYSFIYTSTMDLKEYKSYKEQRLKIDERLFLRLSLNTL